jgi:formylglycine-generating enzyme required for sulfatase activity
MTTTQNQQPNLKLQRRRQSVQFFLERLTDDIGIEMMLILAGTFLMGSPEDELGRSNAEGPQHEVSVSTFFMGKYPVTQAQWQFVAELPQVNRELDSDPSNFKGDKRPVEMVSWYEAVEFCDRLSTYTGRSYRLPSEAEWEYACRASPVFRAGRSKIGDAIGTEANTPFHFGKTITTDLANYDGTDNLEEKWSGSYGQGPTGECREETTPVGHFGVANAFGLCDMHGNVFEWCLDHWHKSYDGAPTDGSAWITEDENAYRIRRGGSWSINPIYCRSAYRYSNQPGFKSFIIGFRVVCVAPSTLLYQS